MRRRRKIGDEKRVRIFKESAYRCVYCGDVASALDHVIPVAAGGSDDDSNLVAACTRCNSIAGDKIFSNFTEKYVYVKSVRDNEPMPITLRVFPREPPEDEPDPEPAPFVYAPMRPKPEPAVLRLDMFEWRTNDCE